MADDRPDWLLGKFESGEALSKSYLELQRAYTQSRQENSVLRSRLAESDAEGTVSALVTPENDPDAEGLLVRGVDPNSEEDRAALQLLEDYTSASPIETMRDLAERDASVAQRVQRARQMMDAREAAATRRAALEGSTAGVAALMADPAQLAAAIGPQAIALLDQQYGENGWDRQAVVDAITANPLVLEPALRTGDPTEVARALANVHQVIEAGKPPPYDATAAKRAAQTLSGTSPRPVETQDDPWQRIVAAGNSGYEGLMRGRQR